MNILFVSGYYPPDTRGGGELSTHYIARGLVERGHTVTVLTSGNTASESNLDGVHIIRENIPMTAKSLFEAWHSRKAAVAIRRRISDFSKYDIVHAHDYKSALIVSELHLQNTVVTARDYAQISGCTNNMLSDGSISPGCADPAHLKDCHRIKEASWPRRAFRYWHYWYNQEYRKQAFLTFPRQIFISHAQEEVIKQFQNTSGMVSTVIYNPVPPEFLEPKKEHATKGNILYVGTVEMYKGVGLLLEAWKTLSKRFQNIHLTIVGDGAQKKEYETLVDRAGMQYSVTFHGRVAWDRLHPVYDQSEIVVAPHIWVEPFGRTVVEAMARETIVVAADAGGPSEIIKAGKTGLLFRRNDLTSLKEMLVQAITMNHYDKRDMARKARTWVSDTLSISRIAEEHERFYQLR